MNRVLDFSRPIAVLLFSVLHFVSDEDDPKSAIAAYRDATVPGSYLAITHGTADYKPKEAKDAREVYARSSHPVTSRAAQPSSTSSTATTSSTPASPTPSSGAPTRRARPTPSTATSPATPSTAPWAASASGMDGCVERLMRTRPWGEGDLTGGPLDEVLQRVRSDVPDLIVERLVAMHPGDDDNVYLLGDASGRDLVQVDTDSGGQPTFFIEGVERTETADVMTAAAIIVRTLKSGHVRPSDDAA